MRKGKIGTGPRAKIGLHVRLLHLHLHLHLLPTVAIERASRRRVSHRVYMRNRIGESKYSDDVDDDDYIDEC